MGQFGNQPDFITQIISVNGSTVINPSNDIDRTTFLDGSIIYVGTAAAGEKLNVIPVGTVGPSVITGFTSPGFTGHGGTGYTTENNLDTIDIDSSGDGNLIVDIVALNGVVISVTVGTNAGDEGAGYLNGDLIAINQGNDDAVFRIVAAPGLPTAAESVSFINPPQGEWFPVVVDYVLATNTTVSDLRAGK